LLSEPGTVARAFETRRALFTVMAWTTKSLDEMLRGERRYSPALAELSAHRLEALAPMLDETFALDERTSNVQTRALPDIWERRELFTQRANELTDAAHALSKALRTSDRLATLREASRLMIACNNCHMEFRKGGTKNVGAVYP
jgi:cytochrome c556